LKKEETVMPTKKEDDKKPRVCGGCGKAGTGHNARTCPENPKNKGKVAKAAKAEEAEEETQPEVENEEPVKAEPEPKATKAAKAAAAPPAAAPLASDHAPVEFEEFRKQVDVKGTSICLSIREYTAGLPIVTLRTQDEKGVKEVQMGPEVLAKTWELFGVVLQKLAVRKSDIPHVRANSKTQAAATT
jgi:hypothetical protein